MRFSKRSVFNTSVWLMLLLMTITSVEAVGQNRRFSNELWHQGFIVTAKQDTVKGMLKYDLEANSIQLKGDQKVYSFSSHTILMCEFYDGTIDNVRRFYSMPYELNNGYKSRILFELLFEGPTSLLSREEIIQETNTTNLNYGGTPFVTDRLRYDYFLLNNKGEIQYYSGKRSDLLDLLDKKSPMVKSFIKENKLKTDNVRDLIRIIAFYNTI